MVIIVIAFPPVALPTFIGTIRSSDFLPGILSSSLYYRLSDILSSLKDQTGSPGLPIILVWSTCHALRPRGAENHLLNAISCSDFR